MKPSNRIAGLQSSATIELANRVKDLKAQGKDIIELGSGDPDFDTPGVIKEAAVKALYNGKTHYSLSRGSAGLRGAVCDKLGMERRIGIDR